MALIRPISTSERATSLWQNSSPSTAYAASTVTLADSINNYRYLKIVFRLSTSLTDTFSSIVDTSNFDDTSISAGGTFAGSCASRIGQVVYCRRFCYSAANSIDFSIAHTVNTAGSDNSNLIPIEIIGIK